MAEALRDRPSTIPPAAPGAVDKVAVRRDRSSDSGNCREISGVKMASRENSNGGFPSASGTNPCPTARAVRGKRRQTAILAWLDWKCSLAGRPRMLIAFHKPFGVLSQFSPDGSPNRTLAEFGLPPRVYPLGRLDADSEGLLLLADEPGLNHRLLDPEHGHPRTYWAQVERVPSPGSLEKLARGIDIQGYRTRPCQVTLLDPQPTLAPRDPPIRFRKSVPEAWIELTLHEGKNRQVRRMTAAIGHPTLRLLRVRIGRFELGALAPGAWQLLDAVGRKLLLG